jgi:hypothetical protein
MGKRGVIYVSTFLGVWLIITAFLWPHVKGMTINTALMGIIVVVCSLLSIRFPVLRYVTGAAGVWVAASLFAWNDYSPATVWNNCFVGAGIALASLLGPEEADMFAS